MLNGKDFRALDIVLLFICAFLDCAAPLERQAVLTEMNTIYSDIERELYYGLRT